MEPKTSLASFSDRELLEFMLLNQVQFERRLDRIETYLTKQSQKEAELIGETNDYYTAAHNQDGRREGYSLATNFKELIDTSHSAKLSINEMLKREDSEISW